MNATVELSKQEKAKIAERKTSHDLFSLWQKLRAQGKKMSSEANTAKEIYYQMWTDEQMLRKAIELLRGYGATPEELRTFEVRVMNGATK